MGKGKVAQLEQPETPYQRAMGRMADRAKAQSTEDEWARKNRRPQPLDGLNTGPVAERYATHERCFWTETPDGKALARPLYTQESDGFLLSIEPVKEVRMPERKYRTIAEVAEMLDISKNAVHDAIDRGELHAFSPGKVKRVLLSELRRYLREKHYTEEYIEELITTWQASLPPMEAIQATEAIGCA